MNTALTLNILTAGNIQLIGQVHMMIRKKTDTGTKLVTVPMDPDLTYNFSTLDQVQKTLKDCHYTARASSIEAPDDLVQTEIEFRDSTADRYLCNGIRLVFNGFNYSLNFWDAMTPHQEYLYKMATQQETPDPLLSEATEPQEETGEEADEAHYEWVWADLIIRMDLDGEDTKEEKAKYIARFPDSDYAVSFTGDLKENTHEQDTPPHIVGWNYPGGTCKYSDGSFRVPTPEDEADFEKRNRKDDDDNGPTGYEHIGEIERPDLGRYN